MLGISTKIERHIFNRALKAFLAILILLTVVLWITESLRTIDLVTTKGQSLQLFVIMSSLAIPSLVVILAPIALLIAVIYVLHSMHSDSELVVIASTGGSPKRITRPMLWLGSIIMILIGFMSVYAAPMSLQKLRGLITQVRADLINVIMKPGAFTNIEGGMMVHIKERTPDGKLNGILISDTRNPDISFRYLAQNGAILETASNTYLVLQDGHILRRENDTQSASIVEFASYAFDLSQFRELDTTIKFRIKERSTQDLMSASPSPQNSDSTLQLSAEFHKRITSPFYALAFPLIALLFMATPQTTRSAHGLSIILVIVITITLRGLGFASEGIAETNWIGIPLLYIIPLGSAILSLILLWQNVRLDFAQRFTDHLINYFALIGKKRGPKPLTTKQ